MALVVVDGPTIAAGESLSDVADATAGYPIRIKTPADWTPANISFQVSPDGVTFDDLVDRTGREILIAVPPNARVHVPAAWPSSGGFFRFRSGSRTRPVVQQAERQFSVTLETSSGGGGGAAGIPEAPADNVLYGRRNRAWERAVEEAPNDGGIYARQNQRWAPITSGAPPLHALRANDYFLLSPAPDTPPLTITTGTAGVRYVRKGPLYSRSSSPGALPMPATTQAGDLLLAWFLFIDIDQGGITPVFDDPSWTLGGAQRATGGGLSTAWAWKIATGADPPFGFSWVGAADCRGQVIEANGNDPINPIGSYNEAFGVFAGPPQIDVPGVVAIRAASAAWGIVLTSGNHNIVTPAGYIDIERAGAGTVFASNWIGGQIVATQGATSDPVRTTLPSPGYWNAYCIEITAAAP